MLSEKMFNELVKQPSARAVGTGNGAKQGGPAKERKKVTPLLMQKRSDEGKKIIMVTAYDYPTARWADQACVDVLLVSDALGTVGLGRENTLSVTVDEIIYHTKAVKAGAGKCLVLSTMPFQSYASQEQAVHNAGRLVQEGGAHGVEIEGTQSIAAIVSAVVDSGIAVAAHVGLTKNIASRTGHYQVQGRSLEQARSLIEDAVSLEKAGAFALILECMPKEVAGIITSTVSIPTIGIGAGPLCSGQALVTQDMLGMFDRFCPSFVKKYAELSENAVDAIRAFVSDVEAESFPDVKHASSMDQVLLAQLHKDDG